MGGDILLIWYLSVGIFSLCGMLLGCYILGVKVVMFVKLLIVE